MCMSIVKELRERETASFHYTLGSRKPYSHGHHLYQISHLHAQDCSNAIDRAPWHTAVPLVGFFAH